MEISLKYTPLPKQKLFHNSGQKFRAYAGGFGSGKTICGAAEAIQLSMEYPRNLGLVGRMTYPELRDTTWKEVLDFPVEIDGKEMPLLSSPLIKSYNKAEHSLEFVNGSAMIARALEQSFHKIKSLNLGWFWIDEGTEANEEIWLGLSGRLRRKGVRHTGFLTTNPEGHDWVWKKFLAQKDNEHFLVTAPSTENTFLPEGYVDGLIKQYPEEWVKRYVHGSFDTFEGLVYKDFQDKEPFVIKPFEIPDTWYRFLGLDHGYRNPTAVLWGAVSPEGRLVIYDEFYSSGKLVSEVSTIIKTKNGEHEPRLYLIDPSCRNRDAKTGRSIIDEFADNGLYFEGANNDVRAGINHVQEYLKLDKTQKPRLQIFQNCVNLRTELQTYRWKDLKPGAKQDAPEKPMKKDDHLVDALRYMTIYLYATVLPKVHGKKSWRDYFVKREKEETHWMAA